jgi:hypothetical protein
VRFGFLACAFVKSCGHLERFDFGLMFLRRLIFTINIVDVFAITVTVSCC